jgi:Tfp pilus assembly protein FimT
MIGIIAVLTLIAVPNYNTGGSQLALQRSANKLAQDIRQAEELAISAKEHPAGTVPEGYGIYLVKNAKNYILYADGTGSNDEEYDVGEGVGQPINFENGVYIKDISSANGIASINFRAPDPIINLDITPTSPKSPFVTITIALESDPAKTKVIFANIAGLIYVQ